MQDLACDNRIVSEVAHRREEHVFRERHHLQASELSASLPHAVRAAGPCMTRLILVVTAYLMGKPRGGTGCRWKMPQR